jgi:hypothetical protein
MNATPACASSLLPPLSPPSRTHSYVPGHGMPDSPQCRGYSLLRRGSQLAHIALNGVRTDFPGSSPSDCCPRGWDGPSCNAPEGPKVCGNAHCEPKHGRWCDYLHMRGHGFIRLWLAVSLTRRAEEGAFLGGRTGRRTGPAGPPVVTR